MTNLPESSYRREKREKVTKEEQFKGDLNYFWTWALVLAAFLASIVLFIAWIVSIVTPVSVSGGF